MKDRETIEGYFEGLGLKLSPIVSGRGLTDIQNALLARLYDKSPKWKELSFSFLNAMRRKFGNAVLTEALTQLVGAKAEPQNPAALVMVKCQMIAGGKP